MHVRQQSKHCDDQSSRLSWFASENVHLKVLTQTCPLKSMYITSLQKACQQGTLSVSVSPCWECHGNRTQHCQLLLQHHHVPITPASRSQTFCMLQRQSWWSQHHRLPGTCRQGDTARLVKLLNESAPSLPGYARSAVIDLVQSKPQFYPMPSWTYLSQLHGPKVWLQVQNSILRIQCCSSCCSRPIQLLTTQLLIRLVTRLLTCLLTRLLTRLLTPLLTLLLSRLLTRLLTRLRIRLLTCLLTGLLTGLLACLLTGLLTCLLI